MSKEMSVNLTHSMEQMYVNTPVGKTLKNGALEGTFLRLEDYSSTPLSPPPTDDARQKRERSESLMLYHTNEARTTKRRLRSRSRNIIFDEDSQPSMITPCSSKPKVKESVMYETMTYSKGKHFDTPVCSTLMTPCSEEPLRKPLQNRDLNSTYLDSELQEKGLTNVNKQYDYSSDSSDDDELKTKLTFDDEEEEYRTPVAGARHFHGRLIGPRMGENKIDFIQELVILNCEEICKKIFCYLEPKNLQRVASVSKEWRRICKKDRIASPRLDQFIHGRKQYVLRKGKENLGHNTKPDHKAAHRLPLSVRNNTIWTPVQEKTTKDNEVLDKIKMNMMSTYEKVKCPACGSPSRKLNNEVCECDKCKGTFCQVCQHQINDNHNPKKCAIKVNKPKKNNKEVVGSKHSKNRLKRF